jgi:hypothetical protein
MAAKLKIEKRGDEISKAVKLQKPDKSPGEDGIVSEFYRHYWYLIGEDFESVVREKLFLHHKSLYPLDLIFFPNYLINMRPNHCPILPR